MTRVFPAPCRFSLSASLTPTLEAPKPTRVKNLSSNSFRCYIIGADTLLLECCEQILSRGHTVLGVITNAPRIQSWARERSIRTIPENVDYCDAISGSEFEYFFSITHLAIVKDEVLSLPSKAAINFHDGPLPAYAGLNAPSWGLIEKQQRFGVTWHEMASGVDAGRILESQSFDVSSGETSLTINMKCFQAGMTSFARLLADIEADHLHPVAQDASLRGYYGKFKRPEAACSIDWNASAVDIEALVRALDFGNPYRNPLGRVNLSKGKQLYLVIRARALKGDSGCVPGEILDLKPSTIVVATREGSLSIEEVCLPCGKPLSLSEFGELASLQEGGSFDLIDSDTRRRLAEYSAQLARSEEGWIQRLETLSPLELPYSRVASGERAPSLDTAPIALPTRFEALARSAGISHQDYLVAGISAYLQRLVGSGAYDVGYSHPELRDATFGLERWVNESVFFKTQFDRSSPLAPQIPSFSAHLAETRGMRTWLRDAAFRYPETRAAAGRYAALTLPVGISIASEGEDMGSEGAAALATGEVLSFVLSADASTCSAVFDPQLLPREHLSSVVEQLEIFLGDLCERPEVPVGSLNLLTDSTRQEILAGWNRTEMPYDTEACIGALFEKQVQATPDAPALIFDEESLSYRQLNQKANSLAMRLQELGVRPGVLVGICIERSPRLLVSVLGVLKAGGAYVPLDPTFPVERIRFMAEDSKLGLLILEQGTESLLQEIDLDRCNLDDLARTDQTSVDCNPKSNVRSSDLAYVIYTSGSTGMPKGVMVEHRNVVNFFIGMDSRIPRDRGNTWLAVTSLSFDISVLELLWTLTRGMRVVLYRDPYGEADLSSEAIDERAIDFSIFLWGSDGDQGADKYRIMIESAKFADENGFLAIWTPERHFHAFGGPYANPSLTGAAIAAVTKRLRIRSGSIVVPLHHPVRIVEEWSMVDNLSGGRVDLGLASGWQPDDFLFQPQNHAQAKEVMFENLKTIRALWKGEKLAFPGPLGEDVEIATQPRPIQDELQIWITVAGNPETYRRAGEIGANILTHLLGQSLEQVAKNLEVYREALVKSGYPRESGKVTLMLHTFVGETDDEVLDIVRGPLKDYLGSSVDLAKKYTGSFPTFRRPGGEETSFDDMDLDALPPEDVEAIIEHSFLRYFETSGLLGSFERCVETIRRCKAIGVDEIGCLIDYGVDPMAVLESLPALNGLRKRCQPVRQRATPSRKRSISELIREHNVSHLQCTPSMARMIVADREAFMELDKLECLMVGGEAVPADLVADIRRGMDGTILNMYGPTETTVWSTTYELRGDEKTIPIGRPIANTQVYVLDEGLEPLPPGVPGELYVGGDGVVRGYLEREELTAERFLKNPFVGRGGARIYATGDRARFSEGGVLEFLGRSDYQVKVRGYRIELGEIEARLLEHPSVDASVVMTREDVPGDVRLVAYFQCDGKHDKALLPAELRLLSIRYLPDYMVPSHYVQLDRLPLTPNGKLDRSKLPVPAALASHEAVPIAAPKDELENDLVELWKRVLVLREVSVDANFFDLGGHSLLLVRMHQELQQLLERRIDLTTLYQCPSIRTLALCLQSESQAVGAQTGRARAERRQARRRRR